MVLQHRRRRWPWWVTGGTAALLLAVGSFWWIGANVVYYQPLRLGPWIPPPNEGATHLSLVGDTVEVVPARANAEFRVGTSITNRGDHPIRIRDVAPIDADAYFEPIATVMVPVGSHDTADLRPFEPFDLAPNEYAWVGHLYRFRDCPFPSSDPRPLHQRLEEDGELLGRSGYTSWTDLGIEFTTRGWTRHTSVELMAIPILDGVGDVCPAGDGATSD
ncbi:hypothetical protein GH723_12100 [Actinomarinicola tropica]|uniref:Uncharacterized protein n=1 Tax=Actinomarinicola tropica TaxID=2789776 RepID=A0A5Q2RG42_9ACTN|nr:hypothetical protein GH723_12100 [Actinomarinicola tropica]